MQAELKIRDWRELDGLPDDIVASLRRRFRTAAPFPHLVLDDLFHRELTSALAADFDRIPAASWEASAHRLQTKRGTRPDAAMPAATQDYFDKLHSGPFLRLLSRITGVENLIPDPSLRGGGMHQIATGGRFELHVDFARHAVTGLDNRLVVITYLNERWHRDYGGTLELWRLAPKACEATIVPELGRTIIMAVGPACAHGHPEPVRAPDGRPRRSVAAYFYTGSQPAGVAATRRGSTAYIVRPGSGAARTAIVTALNILPPAIVARARRMLGRRRNS